MPLSLPSLTSLMSQRYLTPAWYARATPPMPDEYTWALTVRWNFQANNNSSASDNFREIAVRELLKNNVRFV